VVSLVLYAEHWGPSPPAWHPFISARPAVGMLKLAPPAS
jgi:hypothetical protein